MVVMSHQIIRQPDGLLCVRDFAANGFVLRDATGEDVIRHFAEKAFESPAGAWGEPGEAVERAALQAAAEVNAVVADQAWLVYENPLTFEQVAGETAR